MIILFHRKVHGASVCLSNKLFLENFNSSDVLRYTKRRKISPLGRNFLKSDRINHIMKGARISRAGERAGGRAMFAGVKVRQRGFIFSAVGGA